MQLTEFVGVQFSTGVIGLCSRSAYLAVPRNYAFYVRSGDIHMSGAMFFK